MKLSVFLRQNQDEIIKDWVSFARTLQPAAKELSSEQLRDHLGGMLRAIGKDLETRQSAEQQKVKSHGDASPWNATETAAGMHGEERYDQGLTLTQVSAEFRALRASVLRLWLPNVNELSVENINDMVRFNEAIDQALMESIMSFAKHTDNTREMFLAILENDLQMPLASLSLAGKFLVGGKQPGNTARIGDRVKRNVDLMKIVVNDLMEFTRAQLGAGISLKRSRENIRDIAEAALAHVEAVYPDYKFELHAGGDLIGSFDNILLNQLFTDLLVNAGQSGEKGQPIIMHVQGEPDKVIVKVSNRGLVIDKDALKSIFKPLVQTPGALGTPFRPTSSMGLGLFIVQQIANAHGGSVGVSSNAVDGTTFTVQLPRRAATD